MPPSRNVSSIVHQDAWRHLPINIPRERVVGNGATYSVYDVKAMPALYLVEKKGILRCSPTDKNLEEWIEPLLTE